MAHAIYYKTHEQQTLFINNLTNRRTGKGNKMKKSEIFKKAHQAAKSIVSIVGNYAVAFSISLKEVYAMADSIADKMLEAGLKVWEKGNMKRIYMNCEQFNQFTGFSYSLNDNNNKFFYDYSINAIMRSYKGKKATIEVQY